MSTRTCLSLDGRWYFSTTEIPITQYSSPNTDNLSLITVPAPWQADARFRDHTGMAWYQREFDIPTEWLEANRVVILGFGAVDYFAEVWLNDVKVGEHEGGYLPFELDITAAALAGTNTLTVRVDDPLEIFAEIPHGKQSWYGLLSGIWQPVWVESRPATHIQRVKITPHAGLVEVAVTLNHPITSGQTIAIEILAPDGVLAARAETSSLNYQLPIPNPQTWDIDSPRLYQARVILYDGLTAADEVSETFGFRTIETRDGQILLNGRPFYLRGALDQDYYPDLICTPPSQEYIEDEFRKAKEMGLNCLRVHIKVADPRYYSAADKIGLLIWTELPNHDLLSDDAKRHSRETLAGMLERDGNHPSIAIWTIINESWGIDLTDASQRLWLAETYEWMKSLDPTRLVVGNSACWGNYHVATDIADFHNYYAMPDHYQQWREWVENYARRPWWLFAPAYQDHAAWREFARDHWHADERPYAAEVRQRGDEPLLVSEFGNWGLPDVTRLYEGNRGSAPWWFDTGLEWGNGVVYPHGVEKRFREYHLDKVFPSLPALSEASQHLQFDALKYEIEQMRRHESIQGYVITEFTDVHWECNGLLDMYRNPKAYHARLKEINADDVLITLWERLVFSVGETCKIKALCSHYSALEMKEAVLEWMVTGEQLLVIRDQLPVGEYVAPGGVAQGATKTRHGVTEVGVIAFDVPHVEQPTKARLELRLLNGENGIASSHQEIYIFPKISSSADKRRVYSPEFRPMLESLGFIVVDDLSQAELAVVSTLDDACREFLLRGGKVLFLAEDDEALQTHIPNMSIEPRRGTPWQGDWASSFGWHRFKNLPTDHVVNFAFADLTPEHVIHGFAPRDFASDVYAGLFVGWLHKPIPTIARKRVG
ncbi:MAG TPA: glycoside hydrolase family 2 TIM barrel-domain containing protein, partial [Anaerolineales bacterium]|nr:glycoside hydrolase family 2 TIM barrel-domain containing protein [Anaerolineales bacterium]